MREEKINQPKFSGIMLKLVIIVNFLINFTSINTKYISMEMSKRLIEKANLIEKQEDRNAIFKSFTSKEELHEVISNKSSYGFSNVKGQKAKNKSNKKNLLNYLEQEEVEQEQETFDELDVYDNNMKKVAEEDLKNFKNVQYFGQIFLGSKLSKHTVIFDTGSNILWLPSKKCKSCRATARKFNYKDSDTFVNTHSVKNITYAVGFVQGELCRDMITLKNAYSNENQYFQVKNYNFLLVNEEKQLGNTISDGVLGLGYTNEGVENNSLVQLMYLQGLISQPKFTVILGDKNEKSRIYFGNVFAVNKPNGKPVLDKQDFDTCYIGDTSQYWACEIRKIQLIGNNYDKSSNSTIPEKSNNSSTKSNNSDSDPNSSKIKIKPQADAAVFDTGTSFLIIPYFDFLNVVSYFLQSAKEKTCALTNYMQLMCKCDSPKDFPNFKLNMGTGKVDINIEDITMYSVDSEFQCQFQIMTTPNKFFNIWILGDSVLRKLVVEFDMANRSINYASKDDLFKLKNEDEIENKKISFWLLAFIYIAVILFAIMLGIVIWKYCINPVFNDKEKEINVNNVKIRDEQKNILDNNN